MTYEVTIDIKRSGQAEDARRWCEQHGWRHIVDWRWFKPDYFKDQWYYIFQFDDPKKANWFAIRWAS